ncbi:DUF1062 domain-containing protein [Aminobacter aminovorans]|uniref:DUF1062 domain-containing protein n=1 Tax=Aminobacter aminovorans TaxID=83263 RepID=UPI002857C6A1|nr:DUF1062 domain-containing protein [Aminobacter aminovorans]MDR7221324.1 hypothetical protein [Aminobacter aminovorans]
MSNTLRVRWIIAPVKAPEPWLPCSRCGGPRAFQCSRKFRVNANGRRLDAWLIYRCSGCNNTWNRPIVERRNRHDLDPCFLQALETNDPELADRFAHDVVDLETKAGRLEQFVESAVKKRLVSPLTLGCSTVEIICDVTLPSALRIDRLLAGQLGLSRNRIEALAAHGRLAVAPGGQRALQRAIRDGVAIALDLSKEADAAAIVTAAAGLSEVPSDRHQLSAIATDADCPWRPIGK